MHKRRSAVYFRTSCMASVSQMFFKFIMPCLSRYLACGSSLWPIHPVDVVPQPVVAGWIGWHAALKIILTGCVCPHMMTYPDMHACSPFSSSALRPFVALCWQQAGWLELLGSYSFKKTTRMHACNGMTRSRWKKHLRLQWRLFVEVYTHHHVSMQDSCFCVFNDMGGWNRWCPFQTDSHPKTTNRCCLGLKMGQELRNA